MTTRKTKVELNRTFKGNLLCIDQFKKKFRIQKKKCVILQQRPHFFLKYWKAEKIYNIKLYSYSKII